MDNHTNLSLGQKWYTPSPLQEFKQWFEQRREVVGISSESSSVEKSNNNKVSYNVSVKSLHF